MGATVEAPGSPSLAVVGRVEAAVPARGSFEYGQREARLVLAAKAAQRSCDRSVISHEAAALIHGLPLLRIPAEPSVTVRPSGTGDLVRARLHRATLDDNDVVERDGVAVTSVARTAMDVARSGSTTDGVVTLDCALNRGLVTAEDIDDILRRCWNWPRIARASRAAGLADAHSESPLESVSRLVMGWAHLRKPQLQQLIRTRGGVFVGRADFYWDEFGVVGEADGVGKYQLSTTSLLDEKRRQERLEELGLVVVRCGWDAAVRPAGLRERIESAFTRGAARDRSGSPRLWSI